MRRGRIRSCAAVCAAIVAVAACSGDDDDSADDAAPAATGVTETSSSTQTAVTPGTSVPPEPSGPPEVSTAASPSDEATPSTIRVPVTGVPGLASDDAFCAAWSRYAGSYQVIAVASAFGTGSPDDLAVLEVTAAPTVVAAFDDLFAAWPAELDPEREVASEEFFGPLVRRLAVGRDALVDAGADEASLAGIDEAWVAALAGRDQDDPDFAVDLPDEYAALVDVAADDFSAQLVAFADDPSLVTAAETPMLDEYLAVGCPDQGTLGGQEVDGG